MSVFSTEYLRQAKKYKNCKKKNQFSFRKINAENDTEALILA